MPTNYKGYVVPVDEDVADAPKAFTDFTDSIPFSEYIEVVEVGSDTAVDDTYNGKMIVATESVTLTFGSLPEGFSVAAVAEADKTIEYVGVDKSGEITTAYEVATVVSVGGTNILSVPRGGDVIIDGGVAEGTPPAPVLTNPDGGSVVSFTSGGEGSAGPTLAYGATIEPQDGATVEVDQDNLEVSVLGTTVFTDYVVSVFGVNVAGKGEEAKTNAFQMNYNEATGGTETIVDNYNGTTEKWKVHTFTSDDTFNVSQSPQTFSVLVVGAGKNGGGSRLDCCTDGNRGSGAGGAGGRYIVDTAATLPSGPLTVTVATTSGGDSVLDTLNTSSGTEGGAGGGGRGGSSTAGGGAGSAGVTSMISGSPVAYAGGGGGGGKVAEGDAAGGASGGPGKDGGGSGAGASGNCCMAGSQGNGQPGTTNTGGGGGGGSITGQQYAGTKTNGGAGGSGIVIVAYKIGTSTTREIALEQAEQEARAAGVEEGLQQGIEQGRQEGYAQAQEDLSEVIEAGRTTLQDAVEIKETTIVNGKEKTVIKRPRRK